MKIKLLLSVLFVIGLGACTQKTCPTYTKNDKSIELIGNETEQSEENV